MKIARFAMTLSCCLGLLAAAPVLKAGDTDLSSSTGGKQIIVYTPQSSKTWNCSVTSGWDSLYMRNGVNMLGSGNGGVVLKQK